MGPEQEKEKMIVKLMAGVLGRNTLTSEDLERGLKRRKESHVELYNLEINHVRRWLEPLRMDEIAIEKYPEG